MIYFIRFIMSSISTIIVTLWIFSFFFFPPSLVVLLQLFCYNFVLTRSKKIKIRAFGKTAKKIFSSGSRRQGTLCHCTDKHRTRMWDQHLAHRTWSSKVKDYYNEIPVFPLSCFFCSFSGFRFHGKVSLQHSPSSKSILARVQGSVFGRQQLVPRQVSIQI